MEQRNFNEEEIEEKETIMDKLKYFPLYIKIYIKKFILGLLRFGGVLLTLTILSILYFTGSYKLIFYKVNLIYKNYNIESDIRTINMMQRRIEESKKTIECTKNQIIRESENKVTEILYCNN